jgi:hypothetical protein
MEGIQKTKGSCEKYTKLWTETLKERDHLGDLPVNGSIILKWLLKGIG